MGSKHGKQIAMYMSILHSHLCILYFFYYYYIPFAWGEWTCVLSSEALGGVGAVYFTLFLIIFIHFIITVVSTQVITSCLLITN